MNFDSMTGMNGTYQLTPTTCVLGDFRRVAMTVGNNGDGVHDVVLGPGDGGVGVRDIMTNGRNGCICIYCKRLLGAGG